MLRRGCKDAELFVNVKPFKKWLEEGRQVNKGEKSIRGLFHISQTSELPKPSAKPAAKGNAKAAKGKPTPATLPLA